SSLLVLHSWFLVLDSLQLCCTVLDSYICFRYFSRARRSLPTYLALDPSLLVLDSSLLVLDSSLLVLCGEAATQFSILNSQLF
ncbi:MAG: hypothetical protein K2H49_02410, partial [Muribaculaceae bacterium]|nr:hypothetical protein [Muribaculaceae bacterium]